MTLHSMTAFARQQSQGEWGSLVCELRSVNHRYLDCYFRLPEPLREIEMSLREHLRQNVARGKVECNFRYQASGDASTHFSLDDAAFWKVLRTARKINAELNNPADINALQLMQWPGVLQQEDSDYTVLQQAALQLFQQTVEQLQIMREQEGRGLTDFIEQRLAGMQTELTAIEKLLPEIKQQQRQRLQDTVAEVKLELEPTRLEQEFVLLAQKADIAEELHRLSAHISEIRKALKQEKAVGRRLDFLVQELHREANTIASKSGSTQLTAASVELRVLIEQIREQVQNIE